MIKQTLKKIGLFNQAKYIYLFFVAQKNKIRNFFFPTAIILTYHRVANTTTDPHLLAVSPENFYDQVKYLKENYQVISLNQLITEIKNKTLKRKTVVITFDDGYADNLYNALPVLEKLEIPATIFVASDYINKASFFWDENTNDVYNRPLTTEELLKLSANKLISIGGHTLSHPHIPTLDKDQKINEIAQNKNRLREVCGKEITLFAFPFGEFDTESIEITKNFGYSSTCLLGEKRILNSSDVHSLPRFLVRNWDLKEFINNLKFKFL